MHTVACNSPSTNLRNVIIVRQRRHNMADGMDGKECVNRTDDENIVSSTSFDFFGRPNTRHMRRTLRFDRLSAGSVRFDAVDFEPPLDLERKLSRDQRRNCKLIKLFGGRRSVLR